MKKLLIVVLLILTEQYYSQDIKAAYIQTKRLSGYTYSVTVTLFTDPLLNVTRPTIPINYGDGSTDSYTLASTTNSSNTVLKTYAGTHTYSGPGTYITSYLDTFRISGIKNMSASHAQQIYVSSAIFITSWAQTNTGPSLGSYPVTFSANGNLIFYNPSCVDNDGDSLSYEIANCVGTNYYLPGNATINDTTGSFTFSKDSLGLYAFTFKIKEWRKNPSGMYTLIGWSQLDFVMNIATDVGISKRTDDLEMLIYPNPVANELNICFDKGTITNYTVEIENMCGQILLKTNYTDKINMSNLPKGTYILRLYRNGISTSGRKFIKE